ncbi:MAG TPA: amino acid adenylation domain-containing protein [Pyrinomonadaceae bacterium]|nr:amino acid adenylation domain-containing protein [Pyrinomonadaceae bacterium]
MKSNDIANRLASLSKEQRALFESSLPNSVLPTAQPIPTRTSSAAPLPLSFAQQRLWFLDRFEPGSSFYNIPATVRIAGPLNPAVLERAVHEIVGRHEVLRTTFPIVDGRPQQKIASSLTIPVPLVDLLPTPPMKRQAEALRWYEEETCRTFDLERGPLVRVALLRLSNLDHWVVFTFHHIVFDGWSVNVLERELLTLLKAFSAGADSPLPPLRIQYADFALWQRQTLEGEQLEQLLGYWRNRLKDAATHIKLPTDRPRPAVATFRGARRGFTVSPATTEPLRALARQENATVFMVLLAAFQLLLHKYSNQDDVVVGTTIANRTLPELESLIGFFVNSLVLRVDFSGDPTFREIVQRARESTLGALVHQDLPFEQLVEDLRPDRHLSRNPLFQVVFVLQNLPGITDTSEPTDDSQKPALHSAGTAKFDLTIAMVEAAHHFRGAIEYSTDLFDAATIDRMVEHFRLLLDSVASDPDRRVGAISLLTPAERRAQQRFNDSAMVDVGPWRSMRGVLEQVAQQYPRRVALEDQNVSFTYTELDRNANRLSNYLIELGISAEQVVGICLNRSTTTTIATFGVLGAGGAVLPLDPAHPKNRLRYMLEQTEAKLVLTERALLSSFSEAPHPVLCLDDTEVWAAISAKSNASPDVIIRPEQLAYVIFTSGSTGQPKGVMTPHRGVLNLAESVHRVFGHGPDSRVLQFASPSFDASLFEMLIAIASGSTLVIALAQEMMPGQELTRLMRNRQITLVALTPSTLDPTSSDNLPDLDTVVLAAEASTRELAARWGRKRKLFNAYGPTECTIASLLASCTGERVPPLGRPVIGMTVYLLDRHLTPVVPGSVGEIYIGGHGLGRGYIGLPGLTADRFVPDPFGDEPGGRLYRTGDLARFSPDGELEFVGRNDYQVKLRGVRIELGEIEAKLEEHSSVRRSVVIVRRDLESGPRLVAYVVAMHPALTPAELREHLRGQLPESMIPSAFVFLDALPLNWSGKVNRHALPAPERLRTEGIGVDDPPRTAVEEQIAAVWSDILGLERIGVNDNFFDLGGHSLLATQVVARLTDIFRVEVPLREFFLHPTIAGLATKIEELHHSPATQLPPPLVAQPDRQMAPLAFAQERLWFLDRFEPGSAFYNIPAVVRFRGRIDLVALERAIAELVRRHEALRTTFDAEDGRPIQRILPELAVPLVVHDLSNRPEVERELEARRLIAEEGRRPFDLAHGPLLRPAVVRLSPTDHILLVNLHHIVADGWSMGIVIRELNAFYESFVTGKSHNLPPLPLQYADFAIWQREWLSGEVLAGQLTWWRAQLRGAPPTLDLPADRPRPAAQLFRGATYHFSVPLSVAQAVHALAKREGVTSFMALLTAFAVLLYRYTGQLDLVIGTPIANRVRPELEGLIGLFVNTLALRCDLSGAPSFRELLARVRETTLGAYAHQDLPFERLVEILQPERNMSYNPLFQVMFAFQNTLRTGGSSIDEERESHELPRETSAGNGTAKFDLTLFMAEASDGLVGAFEYSTDLFNQDRIAGMSEHLNHLLTEIVEAPERSLDELSLLNSVELDRMTREWNRTDLERAPILIHDLFERQVQRVPNAIALEIDNRELTYAELDRRANLLARELRARGVGPDVPVALLCERSFEMVIAVLGVLKAGGAYLPMDPGNPPARTEQILRDADVGLLLTLERLLPQLSSVPDIEILCLDHVNDHCAYDPLSPLATPRNLAYIIYTSGSTGQPKGVMAEHAATVNRLLWMMENQPLGPDDVVLQKTPLHFDVSVWELLWPICSGAKLVLAEPGGHRDAQYLVRVVAERRVTVLHFVPPMLPAFLDQPNVAGCTALTRIYTSGDALPKSTVEQVFDLLPVELHNMYGPTETAIEVSHWPCRRDETASIMPIGWPMPNVRFYVLDRALQPVPVGVPGELYIGGLAVARGYYRRRGLTAERFLPDPFAEPGSRMYRSGDRVRFRSDRNLEFLGRLDHQVKMRGFRIEIGEIEAALRAHPSVLETVVRLRDFDEHDKRLIAYVVPSTNDVNKEALIEGLRSSLEAQLPHYMIPSAFVLLDELPHTPAGKIDFRALPDVERPVRTDFLGPRTPVERRVAEIWSQVLHIRQIDIRDRFFELGGHSLLATQVVARVNKAFEIEISLRKLFESPTLADFATAVAEAQVMAPVDGPRMEPIKSLAQREEAEMLSRIDAMSDEEVAALLAELSGEEEES